MHFDCAERSKTLQNTYVRPETIEAGAILRLVSIGTLTLDSARELISVPKPQADALKAFAATGGQAGGAIGYAVRFREKVLEEFERMIANAQTGAMFANQAEAQQAA